MGPYARTTGARGTNLTLNYGLRYEFFAPYTEKYGRLALVDTNAAGGFTNLAEVQSGGPFPSFSGNLPNSLVYPFHLALAPRVGVALRLPKQTVVRAGYGMNYTVGQYGTFASTMALQPMVNQPSFVNEQTNEAVQAGEFTWPMGFRQLRRRLHSAVTRSIRITGCLMCRRGTWTCRRRCPGAWC
jgi:hypothetical protein